jgi:hypothetical protein
MVNWLTAFIALIVAFIAGLQWLTARQKVVLDLFDKRFAVYQDCCDVIARFGGHGPNMEDIGKFTGATARAKFLFGPQITEFLEARRLDLITEFTERNRQPVQVPAERQKAAEDKYVARLDRLTTKELAPFI